MSDSGEGSGSAYQRLQDSKSLKEILAVATEFERTARDFYSDLAMRVSEDLRPLVEDLADEEQQHLNLFSSLSQNPEIVRLNQTRLQTPSSDQQFTGLIDLPDLGESPDNRAVLEYALSREQAAMLQYQSLAESADSGPIKDLFTFLAQEELAHKEALEKLYREQVGENA